MIDQDSILVVDDTPGHLAALVDTLSMTGYTVLQAWNGRRALHLAREEQPALILLDINMPGMSGFEVCEHLKADERTSDIPVLFLSAMDATSDKVHGFEVGGVDYVTKPFHFQEMLARIETHLALRRLQMELKAANQSLERRVAERTAELEALNRAYERFVPRAFLSHLGKRLITDVQLEDHTQKEMSILFSDIRDFTGVSERLSPQQTFRFLNDYLGRVSPIIDQHSGFIDTYLGDGLMALFPRETEDALEAAIAIERIVRRFSEQLVADGQQAISVGTGVHTGRLILGIIGQPERMQGTVVADAVNVASRLEEMTKLYGVSTIVSAQTLKGLQDRERYRYRFLDFIRPKGKAEPVAFFELFDGATPAARRIKEETKPQFTRALRHYHHGNYREAERNLEAVLRRDGNDAPARLYLKRARHRQGNG